MYNICILHMCTVPRLMKSCPSIIIVCWQPSVSIFSLNFSSGCLNPFSKIRISSLQWGVSVCRIKNTFSDTNMLNTDVIIPWFLTLFDMRQEECVLSQDISKSKKRKKLEDWCQAATVENSVICRSCLGKHYQSDLFWVCLLCLGLRMCWLWEGYSVCTKPFS